MVSLAGNNVFEWILSAFFKLIFQSKSRVESGIVSDVFQFCLMTSSCTQSVAIMIDLHMELTYFLIHFLSIVSLIYPTIRFMFYL